LSKPRGWVGNSKSKNKLGKCGGKYFEGRIITCEHGGAKKREVHVNALDGIARLGRGILRLRW